MSLFHVRLKELKDNSGKTQQKIAEDLNLTPQTLSYYMNGREPNFDTLTNLADYFGVTIDYLLGRSMMQTFGMDYIHETTGLGFQAIMALTKLKYQLDSWNEETEKTYRALMWQAVEIIADSGTNVAIPDEMDALEDFWINHEDDLPPTLYAQLDQLSNAARDFDMAYRTLRILNRLIRAFEDDVHAAIALAQMYHIVYSKRDDKERVRFSTLKLKTKSGIKFGEYLTSIKALRERTLLQEIYNVGEHTNAEDDRTKYDQIYEKLDSWLPD